MIILRKTPLIAVSYGKYQQLLVAEKRSKSAKIYRRI